MHACRNTHVPWQHSHWNTVLTAPRACAVTIPPSPMLPATLHLGLHPLACLHLRPCRLHLPPLAAFNHHKKLRFQLSKKWTFKLNSNLWAQKTQIGFNQTLNFQVKFKPFNSKIPKSFQVTNWTFELKISTHSTQNQGFKSQKLTFQLRFRNF